MAVYTDVSAEDLGRFLAGYDLGALLSYKGIAEGVENSNFLVHTGTGLPADLAAAFPDLPVLKKPATPTTVLARLLTEMERAI